MVLTVHPVGVEVPVWARSVQFQLLPDGITRETAGLDPTIRLEPSWTVSARTTLAGPAEWPVAVVVPPATLHRMSVGTTAPTKGTSVMTWIGQSDEQATTRSATPRGARSIQGATSDEPARHRACQTVSGGEANAASADRSRP